ncbi:undecaprenyl-diphosphate phosphatase [Bdellovibrionota bacterium FG-1]
MTTFQAIVYGVLQGFTEFLPVGSAAHRVLLAYFTGWTEPSGALLGALFLGSALAAFIYFIHDWASMISCLLQVLIYRKKPMTQDERLPLFLGLATLPLAVTWYYFHEDITAKLNSSPLVIAATLGGFGLLLWFGDSMSRRNKNMYDWNIIDSIVIGVAQIASLIPGCDRQAAALSGGFFRNYRREAAAKFSFFAALPILIASGATQFRDFHFQTLTITGDLSWLTLGVAFVVTFFSSLLAIGAFLKHIQRGGMGQYAVWRLLVAAGVVGIYLLRLRNGS